MTWIELVGEVWERMEEVGVVCGDDEDMEGGCGVPRRRAREGKMESGPRTGLRDCSVVLTA